MRPNNYDLLTIEEKAEILCREGDLIMIVATSDFNISLYALNGEYVEMFYSQAFCKIEQIRVIDDQKRLDFYIQNIELAILE
jgi:hypothetical protein